VCALGVEVSNLNVEGVCPVKLAEQGEEHLQEDVFVRTHMTVDVDVEEVTEGIF
jgi:hypothetical protein